MTPHDQTKLRELAEKWKKEAADRDTTGELGQISDAVVLDYCARELLATLDEMRREELRKEIAELDASCRCDTCISVRTRLESELRELEGRKP